MRICSFLSRLSQQPPGRAAESSSASGAGHYSYNILNENQLFTMDLLADIGAEDQLISGKFLYAKSVSSFGRLTTTTTKMILTLLLLILARTENATLKAKVKELTEQVKVLTVDNAALLAEVEIYRKEAALPTFSKLALGQAPPDDDNMDLTSDYMPGDDFVRAGNGVSLSLYFLCYC